MEFLFKRSIFFAVLLCTVQCQAGSRVDTLLPVHILSSMERVADRQIDDFENSTKNLSKKDWQNGVLYSGIFALEQINGDRRYLTFLCGVGEQNQWDTGPNRLFADDYCVAQMYTQLFIKERRPEMIGHWQKLADTIVVRHFGDSLKVVPGINYKEWAWCDALFMGPPAMAYLSTALNDERYLRKADSLWWKTTEYLYDSTAHLFYRDSRFFDKREANGEKVFWSRGNGWVLAALVRMIQNMPEGFPSRRRYINLFIEMSEKVLSLQQSDGSWHASLLNPAAYKDRETSGTALFCYALAWGVRRDLLPKEEYLPAIARAWGALESAVHPDGKLGFVQKAGDKPWLSGYNDTSPFGAGAFLLAGSEVYRLSAGW